MNAYIYTRMHARRCVRELAHACSPTSATRRTRTCSRSRRPTHMHTHMRPHTHTHVRSHARTHTHLCTHVLTNCARTYNDTIAMICVTKSRTGNYDFRACARARGVSPVVQCSVGHIRFAVCAERSRDNSLRFLRKFHPDKIMEHIDHDYLSTRVIQISSKSKTSFSGSFIF